MAKYLGSLIVGVATALWVLVRYGKRYRGHKIMWILFFYLAVALSVSWFLSPILRRLRALLSKTGVGRRVRTGLASLLRALVSPLARRSSRALVDRGAAPVFYVLFCRSPADTSVLGSAALFVVLAFLTFLVMGSWIVCLATTGVALVVLMCALSLSRVMIDQLTAMRRCTSAASYARYCEDAPDWARQSLEAAYSYRIGLPAPLERYRKEWPDILGWETKEQAKLSDLIVRSRSADRRWLRAWLDGCRRGDDAGTRTVANLAWLYQTEPAVRDECRDRLRAIRERHADATKKIN